LDQNARFSVFIEARAVLLSSLNSGRFSLNNALKDMIHKALIRNIKRYWTPNMESIRNYCADHFDVVWLTSTEG